MPSLICYSSSVLKFSSNEHVFERLGFLEDTIGGCGKITLSSGWFWIKYQFFNSISLMFGAAGMYLVTNGKIVLRVLGYFCKAALLLSKSTSAKVLLIWVSW